MTTTTILSDNGVSSGSAGIKTTGGNDGTLQLQTTTAGGAATTAMTIDTSQNVGVGVVPKTWSGKAVQVNTAGYMAAVSPTDIQIGANSYYTGSAWKYIATGAATNYYQDSGVHNWRYAASGSADATITWLDAVRIDASGNLLVGTTSVNYLGSGFTLSGNSGTTKWMCGPRSSAPNEFVISAASGFGVYLTSTTATSWTSASDERLKDIIEPITDATNKVSALRAVIGKYKADEENTRRSFLIAQDIQAVLPEAVSVGMDGMLGVQYTEVVPLLVAAIQELSTASQEQQALITTLTERIAALEAK